MSWLRNFLIVSNLRHLPSLLRLALSLFLDPRVPFVSKAVALGAIALVLSPIDLPGWIPLLGQGWEILAIVEILDFFVKRVPREIALEHVATLGIQGKVRL